MKRSIEPAEQLDAVRARRFRTLVRGLNALLVDVRSDWPEANYYLQEDSLHILSGPSHEGGARAVAQEHRELISETLRHSGGGGW